MSVSVYYSKNIQSNIQARKTDIRTEYNITLTIFQLPWKKKNINIKNLI